jgi:hypothetical protein
MASEWKKLIVSGSDAELNSVYAETGVEVGTNQIISTDPAETKLSGSFTGSFAGDGSELTGLVTDLRISGSDGSSDTVSLLTDTLAISGSNGVGIAITDNTVTISIPEGSVSSSTQVDYTDLQNIPAGIVSSSQQVLDYGNFATTASNIFVGSQSITDDTQSTNYTNGALVVDGGVGIGKDLNVSGSVNITGLLTVVSMSTQYVTSSQYTIGTSRVIVNDDDSVRFAGLTVVDSGSTAASASILWDSLNNHFIYATDDIDNEGHTPHSAVLLAGPETYDELGNEIGLTVGRVPVATSDHNLDNRPESSSISIDFATLLTTIENGLAVSGSLSNDALTQDRVVLVGVDGELIDSAGLTFDGDSFAVSGSGTTSIDAGVVNITSDDTVSVTSTNDITITSNEGDVDVVAGDFTVNASGEIGLSAPDGIFLSSSQYTQITGDLQVVNGSISASAITGSFSGSFEGDIPAFLYVTASDGTTATIDLQTQALTLATSSAAPSQGIQITATGQTVTFSLTDDITVGKLLTASTGSILGDLTVDGDLTVNGTTTTINTTNLLVEDRFILLNSGSGVTPKGGIVIDEGAGSGSALFYTTANDADRWSLASNVSSTATTATPEAYVAAVVDVDGGQTATATYQKSGNIKIENGEIYIWVDDIP